MKASIIIKENWLTRTPNEWAHLITIGLGLLLFGGSGLYFSGLLQAQAWMLASRESVFNAHEFWRLWTSLFAHADLSHLLSNSLLFIPFAFFLSGYFGPIFFPMLGIMSGGLINLLVLNTMPAGVSILGMSGVVYWMGAAWLTLYALINRTDRVRRRVGKALLAAAVLFLPEAFRPEVSYMSHFIGFVLGALSAGVYYLVRRNEFMAAEVAELVLEDEYGDEEYGDEHEEERLVGSDLISQHAGQRVVSH